MLIIITKEKTLRIKKNFHVSMKRIYLLLNNIIMTLILNMILIFVYKSSICKKTNILHEIYNCSLLKQTFLTRTILHI